MKLTKNIKGGKANNHAFISFQRDGSSLNKKIRMRF